MLARATGKLQRAFIWGSFVTDKAFPRDLDLFLLMQRGFDQEFANLPPIQQDGFTYERAQLLCEAEALGDRGYRYRGTRLMAQCLSTILRYGLTRYCGGHLR
jgi:hypothetical protein